MAERLVPFGKYYLLERVNVGGMAEVFKAKTVGVEGFEKLVAIKRILPSVAEDEEFIKMFIDEAKITSQLSHANLAQTFDLGKINDAYYIAMEYVPGKDLRAVQERLKRRGERVPINIATYVIGRVCEGLDYAHRKRDIAGRELHIVHRDVSPQNVIVSFEGEVKLIDFGIAKAANKITSTQAGILKGKFGYMSPEQVRGHPLDQRSDIFAVGIVLYELCTGERLFTGSSDYSVLEKVQQAKITPPSELVRDIPDRLERVILKALTREPEQRYQHAADLAQDLMRFLIDSHTRIVSRDDVSAFMKAVFPDDDARERRSEAAALDRTRTGVRQPVPAAPDSVRNDQPQQREHHHEPRLREPPAREPAPQPPASAPPPAALPLSVQEQQLREQQAYEKLQREQPMREAQAREQAARSQEAARKLAAAQASLPPPRAQRSAPPKLPASLIAGIDLAAEDVNEMAPRGPSADPPITDPSAPPPMPPALKPPPLPSQPPLAASSAAKAASTSSSGVAKAQVPPPVSWTARDEDEQTEPAGVLHTPAEDEPTRPMSMTELAEAERIFVERERELKAKGSVEQVEVTSPGGPPAMTAHLGKAATASSPGKSGPPPASSPGKSAPPPASSPGRAATPAAGSSPGRITSPGRGTPPVASKPPPAASAPPAAVAAGAKTTMPFSMPPPPPGDDSSITQRPVKAPAPLPPSLLADAKAPVTAQITDPGGPPSSLPSLFDSDPGGPPEPQPPLELDDNTPAARIRRGEPLKPAAPRSGTFNGPAPSRTLDDKRPPYGGRMQVGKPTIVGTDPAFEADSTVSTFTSRARWMRLLKIAAVVAVLAVAAYAWLSVPHKKEELAGPPAASLTVTTQPEDAVVLLDGAQVKGSLDRDYNEPKLSITQAHNLIIRREGFTEQSLPIQLAADEKKILTVKLEPLPGQIAVRSTPSGAQVFLDGQAMGTTPAYLPNVVQEQSHAISLEKRCYRPWQVAIPAHAGKRDVAATLEPIFGACPNMKVEKEEKVPELPVGDPKAMASLGFLSLASRPSASVQIDGVDIGRTTPLVQWPLKVGRHKVRLVLAAKKRDLTVEVRSGQTASEIVDLRKR